MCLTLVKSRLSSARSAASVPPCSTLQTKASARPQHFAGELRRRFRQRHDAQMVGLAVAGGIGRHVGKNHVGRSPPSIALRRSGAAASRKSSLTKFDAGNRFHVENIERDDAATFADAARGHFAPAARRRAEIDDTRARA